MYCEYYQGQVLREKTWFLSAALRNEDNFVFARAIEKSNGLFEFFVPLGLEAEFLEFMIVFKEKGILLSLEKKQNRFLFSESDFISM